VATIDSPLVNQFVVGVFYDSPGIANSTGATAGSPGTFTPPGSERPANLAGMTGITATPATAWTVGQYVATQTADVHWSGTAWVAGRATVGGLAIDVAASTIAVVQQWVDENPDLADEVLDVERARGTSARTTLVDWLEGFIEHRDE
jgi:hypothetical protein